MTLVMDLCIPVKDRPLCRAEGMHCGQHELHMHTECVIGLDLIRNTLSDNGLFHSQPYLDQLGICLATTHNSSVHRLTPEL